MEKYYQIKKDRRENMNGIADFVRANLHYLSKEEQGLFYTIDRLYKVHRIRNREKPYYG